MLVLITLTSLLFLPFISRNYWPLISFSFIVLTLMSFSWPIFMVSGSMMLGLDVMSSSLCSLTLWISALMLLASYKIKSAEAGTHAFCLTVISLAIILLLCFMASNLLLFYIWFEASLIPTMVLIMMWGYQPERIQASMYLMIYTVVASLPLLVIICKIYMASGHLSMYYPFIWFPMDIPLLMGSALMMLAFFVKLPLFSVHLWLPKAHVEAPVAGSMVLAAILLKLGGYGLIRMSLMFPYKLINIYPAITSIAMIGAILTSLICLRQSDLKSLIAYSSIGHMGLLVAGVMSNTSIGLSGGLAMMVAHGLVSSSLFCMANMSYELLHTRSMCITRGTLICLPTMSMWWFMLICANMAAPPSINLLSEILLISATLSHSLSLIWPLMLVSFFTAAYSLFLYSITNHGAPMASVNPLSSFSVRNSLILMMHLIPVLALIMAPSTIIM